MPWPLWRCTAGWRAEGILTLRWVPGHMGVDGNEATDERAGGAAKSVGDAVPRAYLRETSFAHMARAATEARLARESR